MTTPLLLSPHLTTILAFACVLTPAQAAMPLATISAGQFKADVDFVEVGFSDAGQLMIKSTLGGAPTPLAGAIITSINGVRADEATAALQARVHGDTAAFRSHLLAQRWWLYHWKVYGAAPEYRLTLAKGAVRDSVTFPASSARPAILSEEADLDGLFNLRTRPGCAAVLTVKSFSGAHQQRFVDFTQKAFTRIRQEGIPSLLIDISANGGGDDSMWLDGLMPYLATRRYRTGSTYLKRVLEASPAKGEQAGQVVKGEIETWREPQADNPLQFKGKVSVVIGPATYSSAILFANVMSDFGFATLAGSGRAARRTQSGGVREYILPHSTLALWVPRFVLTPPTAVAPDALLEAQAPASLDLDRLCPAKPRQAGVDRAP